VVGEPSRLIRLAALARRAMLVSTLAVSVSLSFAATPALVVTGNCRDGEPHGAYELHMPGGQLRAAGAFSHGKRTGTFLFWNASGGRVALLPFEDDILSGTVALWYAEGNAKAEPRPKLDAAYANGVPAGDARSWYRDGRPRAQFRYDHGALVSARAWDVGGAPMTETQARALAARDQVADEQFYNTLEGLVRDNPPPCEPDRRKP
jgi:hypothetical protein